MPWQLDRNAVGRRIAEKIGKLDERKQDVAAKLGKDKTRISHYLKGKGLKLETLGRLAEALGCSTDYLLGLAPGPEGSDEKKPNYDAGVAEDTAVTESDQEYSDPCKELKLDIVRRTLAVVESGDRKSLDLLITFLRGLELKEEVQPGHRER